MTSHGGMLTFEDTVGPPSRNTKGAIGYRGLQFTGEMKLEIEI